MVRTFLYFIKHYLGKLQETYRQWRLDKLTTSITQVPADRKCRPMSQNSPRDIKSMMQLLNLGAHTPKFDKTLFRQVTRNLPSTETG